MDQAEIHNMLSWMVMIQVLGNVARLQLKRNYEQIEYISIMILLTNTVPENIREWWRYPRSEHHRLMVFEWNGAAV